MKIAVIGSRNLTVSNLENFLPAEVSEIISGGAQGIDTCARQYAISKGLKLTEFLPEYEKYGRKAPLHRNIEIINHADLVFAFWNGYSNGTGFVIKYCKKIGKPIKIFIPKS